MRNSKWNCTIVPTPWCNDCKVCPINQTCNKASEASDGDFDANSE